jgi:DNA polymerase-1
MREMAHQSEDQFMCEVLNDPKRDIHSETASLMFGVPVGNVDKQRHRYPAKRVGFGVITGITGAGLLDQMKLAGAVDWTEDRCDEIIEEWFRIYPGVRTYMEACRTEARRYGFVRDRWGRRRYLPAIHSPIRHVREEAERQSHSFKISASAQGIMKLGMKTSMGRRIPGIEGSSAMSSHYYKSTTSLYGRVMKAGRSTSMGELGIA